MRPRSRLVVLVLVVAMLALGAALGTGLLGRPAPVDPSIAAAGGSPGHSQASAPATSSPVASEATPSTGTASDPPAGQPSPSASGPAIASPSPSLPPSANAATIQRLQGALDRMRQRLAIPGASVTMIFADGSVWTGTTGFADLRARTAVTPDTAFAIASISKTFTAATILELVEEGRLELDERVAPRLPELALDRRITVRMLLAHTSGLHDFFFHPRIDRALLAARRATWQPARSLRYVGKAYFRPGRGWHYSNTNYLLLGLLVERETGRSLATEVRTRFLDRLDLDTLYTQAVEKPSGPLAHGYRFASGARRAPAIDLADGTGVMPFTSVVTAAAGAGSMAGSSADVASWARALYGGLVLQPETLAAMVDPVGTSRYRPRVPYGLGTQAVTIDDRRALGHSGRFLGFRGVMRWLPDEEIAIALLTNQSRRDPGVIARQLLRVVLGPPPTPRPTPKPCAACPSPAP